MPLSVDGFTDGPETRLTVLGEIDLASRPDLIKAIDSALAGDASQIVVDLAGVTFMDCFGMSALIYGREQADARSRGFWVIGATGVPLLVLRITGVLDQIS